MGIFGCTTVPSFPIELEWEVSERVFKFFVTLYSEVPKKLIPNENDAPTTTRFSIIILIIILGIWGRAGSGMGAVGELPVKNW